MEAIKSEGYNGSERTLRNFIKDIKNERYKKYLSEEMGYKVERLHRKKIMSLIFRFPEKLEDKEKEQLRRIIEEDSINKLYELVQSFRIIIKDRRLLELDQWINLAIYSDIEELKNFAQGLQNDIESIRNALKYDYNNGVLEGSINRLKVIKRMMYGRAGCSLLSKRVLYSFT